MLKRKLLPFPNCDSDPVRISAVPLRGPLSCPAKKLPAGGTQPIHGQGCRQKLFCFCAVNCLVIPRFSLCRPSSGRASPCHLPRRGRLCAAVPQVSLCRPSSVSATLSQLPRRGSLFYSFADSSRSQRYMGSSAKARGSFRRKTSAKSRAMRRYFSASAPSPCSSAYPRRTMSISNS